MNTFTNDSRVHSSDHAVVLGVIEKLHIWINAVQQRIKDRRIF